MEHGPLIAKAQEFLRLLKEPERLQALEQSLEAVAGLLAGQVELAKKLVRLERDVQRAGAESASRQKEFQEQERQAEQRQAEATAARQRELATLDQTRDQLKTEVAAIYEERRVAREAIQQAKDEQAQVIAALKRERTEATAALAAARGQLAQFKATIPA